MLSAYVGIASQSGLEVFLPEHDHLVRFLARSSHDQHHRHAVCYWAVLPKDTAQEVERLMELGELQAALLTLDYSATELGPILPSHACHPEDAPSRLSLPDSAGNAGRFSGHSPS